MDGVRSASVNYATQSAQVVLEKEEVDLSTLKKAIQSIGVFGKARAKDSSGWKSNGRR
ncbi:cation transporter [Lunatibacter salilacus]|uniref:cation transporter n=1 Tax=Lunatibacter salilacus TaxID=2483804 RepID=UPI00131BFE55|nr:heavy metal-associated domain-containing protein [Lunatibacter salilacus]